MGKQKKQQQRGPVPSRKNTGSGGFQPLRGAERPNENLKSLLRDRVTLKVYAEEPLAGLPKASDSPFSGPPPQDGIKICKEYANLTPNGLIEELAAKGLFYIGGDWRRNEQGVVNYLKFGKENGGPQKIRLISTLLRNSLEGLQLHKFEVFVKPYRGNGRMDLVKLYAGEPEEGDRPHRIVVTKKAWGIEPIIAA